ncbi:MAG: hypothetical protein IID33_16670 [Planctomycetes bacterium]|nr:hypothetical protein [Planctomycetota bacterium]
MRIHRQPARRIQNSEFRIQDSQVHRRRGSIYVAVLGSSMLVTVVGLSALMATRIERRGAQDAGDLAKARFHARTGIEMGLFRIGADANWRANRTNGLWETGKPVGTGSYTLSGVDPGDGDLNDDEREPLRLQGDGLEGEARFALQVTLNATATPLSCLEVSVHASDIVISEPATVIGDQIISANDDIVAVGVVVVTPDMEAVGGFGGALGPGSTTSGVPPRALPNPGNAFAYYLTHGTPISIGSIGLRVGVPTIYRELLSPTNNPYGGGTNAEGIYIIDCQSQRLDIEDSRIFGTLVVMNHDGNSVIRGSVHLQPAVPNYPALMVAGSYNLQMSASALSEATTGINFNPVGTPYLGFDDAALDDTYPSAIKGIVYVTGALATSNDVTLDGVLIVGNTLSVTGNLNLTYRSVFLNDPPPGFIDTVQMVVVPGSWQQVIN